ncbi:AbiH family protein [Flavobacterium sp. j3]|uniref:AbiH family protein n=1 Tax=Flavobacterium aureirubrum TaxID=3133147 RepID=A0ABU9N9V4_9FLAO
MNILFIIGNGFDMNLGMKTQYSDFYPEYIKSKNDNDVIMGLKERIKDNYESWSCLETAIGQDTRNLSSKDEVDIITEDIKRVLADYLKKEFERFDFNHYDRNKLCEYLSYPEKYLETGSFEDIRDFRSNRHTEEWITNIVTFNYTYSLDKLLENIPNNILGNNRSNRPITLKKIIHIHGYLDKDMVLGVNDIKQIENNAFHDDIDVVEELLKPECNKAINHKFDRDFKNLINKAEIICIYGSSIGQTDKIWWELIGERLKENIRVIIFTRADEKVLVNQNLSNRNRRKGTAFTNRLLAFSNLTEEEKIDAKSKIFVGVGRNIFNNILKTKTGEKK